MHISDSKYCLMPNLPIELSEEILHHLEDFCFPPELTSSFIKFSLTSRHVRQECYRRIKNRIEQENFPLGRLKFLSTLTKAVDFAIVMKLNVANLEFIVPDNEKSLEKLQQNCSQLKSLTLTSIKVIPLFKHLEELNLINCGIKDKQLESLISNISINLKTLSLQKNEITGPGLKILSKFTNLQNLDLSFCSEISTNGIKFLNNLNLKTFNLKSLGYCASSTNGYLSRFSTFTDGSAELLLKFKNLLSLNLSATYISNIGIQTLASLEKLEEIILFTYRNHNVNDLLTPFSLFPNLKRLSLSQYAYGPQAKKILKGLYKFKKLESLTLYHTTLQDENFDDLFTLESLKNIHLIECQVARDQLNYKNRLNLQFINCNILDQQNAFKEE